MRQIPAFINIPLALLAPAAIVCQVQAEDYLSIPQAQKLLFPAAEHFIEAPVTLSDEQLQAFKKIANTRPRNTTQKAWRVEQKGVPSGWFFVDDVIGKHEFITYAAAISAEGKIIGVEILSYRETHGGQIIKPEWRQNFVGKTVADPFKLNQDIPNISGATLSCRNVTDGVKRLLVLHAVALKT